MDAFTTFLVMGTVMAAGAVGYAYYAGAAPRTPLWRKTLAAAYGPAIAALFVVVVFWPKAYRYNPVGVQTFMELQWIPLALVLCSLFLFTGPRLIHWISMPLALVAWAMTFVIGFISINGM